MTPRLTDGRRVELVSEIELPGDYCRTDVTGTAKDGAKVTWDCVFFLLPIARDEGVEPGACSLHQVRQPPHQFRECADGSLEIRESIGAYGSNPDAGYVWHGYLDEGHVWREL